MRIIKYERDIIFGVHGAVEGGILYEIFWLLLYNAASCLFSYDYEKGITSVHPTRPSCRGWDFFTSKATIRQILHLGFRLIAGQVLSLVSIGKGRRKPEVLHIVRI